MFSNGRTKVSVFVAADNDDDSGYGEEIWKEVILSRYYTLKEYTLQ